MQEVRARAQHRCRNVRRYPPKASLRNASEQGMVTVETAIVLGAVIVVVIALILAVSVAGLKGEVCQVARDSARAHSLGSKASTPPAFGRRPVGISVVGNDPGFTVTASSTPFTVGPWSAPPVSCQVSGIKEPFIFGDADG